MDIEAILGMLMAPLILFVLVVAPIWIILHYRSKRQMNQGLKPNECSYCYKAEENGEPSLRQSYNASLKNIMPNSNYPVWLDLDWSNFCNLKCFMCEPTRSSTLALEQGVFTETKGVKKAH